MKFGIITLVSDNYGNKYQNYAVEQIFSEYGEVETYGLENLYHAPEKSKNLNLSKLRPSYIREVMIARPMYQYDINCVDKGIIRNLLYSRKHSTELIALRKKRSERFREFADEKLHISKTVLNRINTTEEWASGFDYFICGSDQIWNPNYATTSELAFCSFAPEKTICLSPSFGVSEIPEYRVDEYADWLMHIYSLSVREQAGKKLIKSLTGRDADVLLDPTMSVSVEKWEALCKKPAEKLPEHYVVCYFLGRIDKSCRKNICDFAKKMELPVVMLFDITIPEYYTLDPGEVLYTVKNADYVLTDSFHGSVFSILFHKNFYVFERNEGGASMNSRIETLLDAFHFQDRFYTCKHQDLSEDRWNFVEEVLEKERSRTKHYLEASFQSIGIKQANTESNLAKVYSGYLKDDNKLMKSASGGAVTAFAEAIILQGGCVFGVSYSDDFKSVEYICCDTLDDLDRIKGSKYCETKKNFALLEKKLQEKKAVLFTGLGCDVAAALTYCKTKGINTENLYTIDIICHGPVSALVYKRFIEDLENKYKSKVVEFICRSKKEGWSSSSFMKVIFENGKVLETPFDYTDYGYIFSHYAMQRCEKCRFKGSQHQGDLCVGDYWGLNANDVGWNKNGVSIIAVQTENGKKLLNMLGEDFVIQETDAKFAFEHNPMYLKSRKSLGNYKKLYNELRENALNETLRKKTEYRIWRKKIKEIQFKSAILRVMRR